MYKIIIFLLLIVFIAIVIRYFIIPILNNESIRYSIMKDEILNEQQKQNEEEKLKILKENYLQDRHIDGKK